MMTDAERRIQQAIHAMHLDQGAGITNLPKYIRILTENPNKEN